MTRSIVTSFLFGGGPPKPLAHTVGLKMAVTSAGKLRPVECEPLADELGTEVTPVGQVADRDGALVRHGLLQFRSNDLAPAQADQRRSRFPAPWVVKLRRIDPCESDVAAIDDNGISVDDVASVLQDLPGRRRTASTG